MSIDRLNALIAEPWDLRRKSLEERLADTGKGVKVKLVGEFIKIDGVEVDCDFETPIGFETVTTKQLNLSVPRAPGPAWSATVELGIKLGVLKLPVAFFRLSGIRLKLQADLDDSTPDRPRLVRLALADITMTGRLEVKQSPTLVLQRVSPNPGPLPPPPPPGTPSPSLPPIVFKIVDEAHPADFDFTQIEIRIGRTLPFKCTVRGRLVYTHGTQTPRPIVLDVDRELDLLGPLENLIIPRDWGLATPIPPLPADQPGFDYAGPALALETAIAKPAPNATAPAPHLFEGMIFDIQYHSVITPSPKFYVGFGDTAIWTGHYLAAEAFRHKVAPTPASLERVGQVLAGVEMLFLVTGTPGLLARAALPEDSPIPADPSFFLAKNAKVYPPITEDGRVWRGYGTGEHKVSRDQYAGVMMGLAYTFSLVDEPTIKSRVKKLVTDVLRFLIANKWCVRHPNDDEIRTDYMFQFTHRLAFLKLGAVVDPAAFGALYQQAAQAAPEAWIEPWFSSTDPLDDYYKFNLAQSVMGILLFLEQDSTLRAHYNRAFNITWKSVRHHQNAYFGLVRVLTRPPADRAAELAQVMPSGHTLRDEIRILLRQWLERRDTVKGPCGMPLQKTAQGAALTALFPDRVAYYTEGAPGIDKETGAVSASKTYIIATSPVPLAARPGKHMDFVWQRAPFLTDLKFATEFKPGAITLEQQVVNGDDDPKVEGPGVDYLLPYWMARHLGIVS